MKRDEEIPKNASIVFIATLLMYIGGELFLSRFHFLDDTFIHLRLAHHLLDYGFYSFNGLSPEFSSSSPLYSFILSLFSVITRTPLLPKFINLFIYLSILMLVLRGFIQSPSNSDKSLLLLFLLLVISSPLCVRWLTDGMETGLIALFAIILAIAAHKLSEGQRQHIFLKVAIFIVSGLAVLLRVEFGYILGICVFAIFARCIIREKPREQILSSLTRAYTRSIPLILGGVAGISILFIIFGGFLPDTAIAKQVHSATINVSATLKDIFRAHVAASFFGVGLIFLWVASTVLAYRSSRSDGHTYILAVNMGAPVFVILLILYQQQIQGIRYFIFLEAFLVTTNILFLMNAAARILPKRLSVLIILVALPWMVFDSVLFYKICSGRSETYQKFVSMNLGYLKNKYGIAWDVGMVGFFTNGYILDINGLVNGREIASINPFKRMEKAVTNPVQFVFANTSQLALIKRYIDTSDWPNMGEFHFPNVSGNPDTHYLLVHPDVVSFSNESVTD